MGEREAVVAWLRAEAGRYQQSACRPPPTMEDGSPSKLGQDMRLHAAKMCFAYDRAADAIERGDHLPLPPRQTAVPDEKD